MQDTDMYAVFIDLPRSPRYLHHSLYKQQPNNQNGTNTNRLFTSQSSTYSNKSLTSTFLPFFLLFADDNLFLFHFQSASGLFLDGFSTSLACITVLINSLISFFLVSLSFNTCSAITPFWSATWAGLTSSVTVIILDFCLSVSYDTNLPQITLKFKHLDRIMFSQWLRCWQLL